MNDVLDPFNIIKQDKHHEQHQQNESRKMDHAFHISVHLFAPYGFYNEEYQTPSGM